MNNVNLQLPKSLYRNLEALAEKEAVPMNQYIIYVLTRQVAEKYIIRVLPDENIIRQKESFNQLLNKWGKTISSKIDEILDKRDLFNPEETLSKEKINRLQKMITQKNLSNTIL